MQTVIKIVNAFVGYAGSSQNPEQTSMRFTSILLAVVSKIAMLTALGGYVLPFTDAQTQAGVSAMAFVAAAIWWTVGAIRAVMNAVKTKTVTQ